MRGKTHRAVLRRPGESPGSATVDVSGLQGRGYTGWFKVSDHSPLMLSDCRKSAAEATTFFL